MENIIRKFSRLFFGIVLGLLLIGLVIGESLYLLNYKKNSEKIHANLSGANSLLIAAESNENDVLGEISSQIVESEARPIIIQRYLEKYKSPLLPYAKQIFDLSQSYGFEYYWIVAIAQQESNLCKKIPENSHNCWGYGIHKRGTLKFDNYNLALNSFADYLKREYFDKGLNTPELIMKKYCPHSDGSWARGVQQFIDEMERGI